MAGLDSYQDVLTSEALSNMGGLAHSLHHDNVNSVLQGPPFINVKGAPYLAKGDGTTNDTTGIQAAIDAATDFSGTESDARGGGTVYLPPGDYLITGTLSIDAGVRFVGAGSLITRIIKTSTGDAIQTRKAAGQNTVQSFHLEGFMVRSDGSYDKAGYGIRITDGIYYSLTDVDVVSFVGLAGIWVNGGIGGAYSRVRCQLNTDGPGLLLDGTGSYIASVNTHHFAACQFRENYIGVKARATGRTDFADCVFESNTKTPSGGGSPANLGIYLLGCNTIGFNGPHFENNPREVGPLTVDTATDTFTYTAHGFNNGDKVQITAASLNTNIPGGTTFGTDYYIVGATADTFQVSTTVGGAAVDITSTGTGVRATRGYHILLEKNGTTSNDSVAFRGMSVSNFYNRFDGDIRTQVERMFLPPSNTLGGWLFTANSLGPIFLNVPTELSEIANFNHLAVQGGKGPIVVYARDVYQDLTSEPLLHYKNQHAAFEQASALQTLATFHTGDTNARFYIRSDGGLFWGPGNATQDTALTRTAANELSMATGDMFRAQGGLKIDVIATASLPAAGAAQDGRMLIEDAGAGDRNVIVYAGGQRFRVDGGVAF